MSKKERTIETLKDIFVGALLVALVCLSAIYMLSYQGQDSYDFTRDKMDAISGETVKYQYLGYFAPSYCLPETIAVSYTDRGQFAFCTENALQTANESLMLFYEKLFTSLGKTEVLTEEEGKAAFAEAMAGSYLYASYFCDLPKSVLCSMMGIDAEGISGEYIREIFIIPEEFLDNRTIRGPLNLLSMESACYSFSAVARDSVGNYYRYTTRFIPEKEDDISFNQNFYFAYSTLEGAMPFDFAALMTTDVFLAEYGFSEKVSDTTVIFRENIALKSVSSNSVVSDALDADYLEALFINPEKVSEYTDEAGTRFYFDGGRNVVITKNGRLTYTAPDEAGVSMKDLFGARVLESEIDLLDYLGATLVLADALEEVKHGDADVPYSLFITEFGYDGETLRISLGCRINGIPVYANGSADMLSIEFYLGNIRSLSYSLYAPMEGSKPSSVPRMMWGIRSALLDMMEPCRFSYAYVVGEHSVEVEILGRKTK